MEIIRGDFPKKRIQIICEKMFHVHTAVVLYEYVLSLVFSHSVLQNYIILCEHL